MWLVRAQRDSSCPDLIRASITLRKKVFRRGWIAGSPVYAKASPGFQVLVRRSLAKAEARQ
jgi:hypothetical protein